MIEVTIQMQDNVSVHVSEWDEGGAWIRLSSRNGSMYTPITREQLKELSQCLQAIEFNGMQS